MTTEKQNNSNSNNMINGIILKGVGGLYKCLICLQKDLRTNEAFPICKDEQETIDCSARGLFRKHEITPMAGDRVKITRLPDGTGRIEEILPRKNSLIRPPISNIDKLVIVVSVLDPEPNLLVVDKMTVMAQHAGIEPVIAINKSDLDDQVENKRNTKWLSELYSNVGFDTYVLSAETNQGIDLLKESIKGVTVAFAGNTGVGKSSVLNRIDKRFELEVGDISKKLGRGKHTTRVAELFLQQEGGFFVDTPGFSSIDISQVPDLDQENLVYSFRDLAQYANNCRFSDCRHLKEIGCAITQAVKQGEVSEHRYESYVAMEKELEHAREW